MTAVCFFVVLVLWYVAFYGFIAGEVKRHGHSWFLLDFHEKAAVVLATVILAVVATFLTVFAILKFLS